MGNSLPGGGVYDSAYDYLLAQAGNSSDSQSIFNNQYLVSLNFVPELASASITALFNGQVCMHCCIFALLLHTSHYHESHLTLSFFFVVLTRLHWLQPYHSRPSALNIASNAILQYTNTSFVSFIRTSNDPLPQSAVRLFEYHDH